MGHDSWTIRFKGYYPIDEQMVDRLRRVCSEIDKVPESAIEIDQEGGVITIDYSQVRDWLEATREAVRTQRVGEHLVVRPPWDEYEPESGDIVLEIDPGAAFGSGLHESTQLCLRALEKYVQPGMTAVDFGTGTGVLAIAAAKLGAKSVTALDIDPLSVESATANVRGNSVAKTVQVHEAGNLGIINSPVDLVTANIVAETIIPNLSELHRILKPGGILIASGLTKDNAPDVEAALPGAGFVLRESLRSGNWVAIIGRKRGDDA